MQKEAFIGVVKHIGRLTVPLGSGGLAPRDGGHADKSRSNAPLLRRRGPCLQSASPPLLEKFIKQPTI